MEPTGTNYTYWKVQMRDFLNSLNVRVWKAVLNGWNLLLIEDANKNMILKTEDKWSSDNSKALNIIFNVVANQFRLTSTRETTKEA